MCVCYSQCVKLKQQTVFIHVRRGVYGDDENRHVAEAASKRPCFSHKPFFDEHETYGTGSQQLSLICKGLNLMEEIEKVRLTL